MMMGWQTPMPRLHQIREQADPRAFYQMLEAYYLNNGLYQGYPASQVLAGLGNLTAMRALRNPANRAVEFHVTHTWPGSLQKSLPLLAKRPAAARAIAQVWQWSNWTVKKQLAVRWFALFGDWFCKVAARPNPNGRAASVFLQNIKPENVTDFVLDERGNITAIRLDTPLHPGNDLAGTGSAAGTSPTPVQTEVWSKEAGYTLYRGTQLAGTPLARLGEPITRLPLAAFGIDFVPFVHASFIDVGEKRGMGVFTHALDKIDEVNRMSSRLHELIFRFNKPTLALLANGTDTAGRPLPPPRFEGSRLPHTDGDEHSAGEDILSLPGTSRVEMLVPPLNYAAHLEAIGAMATELEDDLPELAYYRQRELGSNLSGKAVRLMLGQAVNRTAEARGNLEDALIRAQMMALTIGANAGLFPEIGRYDNGDFEHSFAEREVLPLSAEEHAANLAREVSAGVPLRLAAQRQGWNPAEIDALPAQPNQNTGGI